MALERIGAGALLIATVMGLFGCNSPSAATPPASHQLDSGFEHTATANGNRLELACPQGVRCDAQFDYHALSFSDEQLRMTLFFDPQLADDYTLDSFRQYFQYARIQYQADAAAKEATRILAETTAKGPDVAFEAYADRQLRLRIQGDGFQRVVEQRSSDPDCRTGDIAGQCSEMSRVEAPYTIHIQATTPRTKPD